MPDSAMVIIQDFLQSLLTMSEHNIRANFTKSKQDCTKPIPITYRVILANAIIQPNPIWRVSQHQVYLWQQGQDVPAIPAV